MLVASQTEPTNAKSDLYFFFCSGPTQLKKREEYLPPRPGEFPRGGGSSIVGGCCRGCRRGGCDCVRRQRRRRRRRPRRRKSLSSSSSSLACPHVSLASLPPLPRTTDQISILFWLRNVDLSGRDLAPFPNWPLCGSQSRLLLNFCQKYYLIFPPAPTPSGLQTRLGGLLLQLWLRKEAGRVEIIVLCLPFIVCKRIPPSSSIYLARKGTRSWPLASLLSSYRVSH